MKRLLRRFFVTAMEDGVMKAISKSAYHAWIVTAHKISPRQIDAVELRRSQLCDELIQKFGSTVLCGPFKGLKLIDDLNWGANDRACMLLGLYEQEVLKSLFPAPPGCETFVNLGAADGYYAVGVLVGGMFHRSVCFEATDIGRNIIRRTAELNAMSDCIVVNGVADKNFYKEIPNLDENPHFILIDIEGAEFEILDRDVFLATKNCSFLIEIHEWIADANTKIEKLKADAAITHDVSIVSVGLRDLSVFSELKNYRDNDRWLICSEGRPCLMYWMRLDPKAPSA